ncbi:flagellin [Clostridium sp. OS1-26]|uniref:flagellin N-terminal helical domain-containing protein n=1 Tax=Clostridium sp. OS1-26 TaxID=3070681 RepID=UPI0027E16176|nr:flagellin [Clostridium sp. OS1-26]WML35463.1 flagellin [Clostridium sp. OS1-26]
MIIGHNINAMIAYRHMSYNLNMVGRAMERLSSGLRINRAADDPAGLAISEKMRAQIRGLEQAARNAQDGISSIQVADGALNETHSILQRMRELATQAANGTLSDQDRNHIQEEINQLTSEINSIGNNTEFNTMKLLNGSVNKYDGVNSEIRLQVGPNAGDNLGIKLEDMRAKALDISGQTGTSITSSDGKVTAKFSNIGLDGSNLESALDVSNHENASAAIKIYDDAIKNVSSFRGRLGATQNVLEHRINYLNNTAENLTAAESRIRDADMAKEMMNYAKYNILLQVSQAILAQANHQAEGVIQLLKSL